MKNKNQVLAISVFINGDNRDAIEHKEIANLVRQTCESVEDFSYKKKEIRMWSVNECDVLIEIEVTPAVPAVEMSQV